VRSHLSWVTDKLIPPLVTGVILGLFTYLALPKFAERWSEPTCDDPRDLVLAAEAKPSGDAKPADNFPRKGRVSYSAKNLTDGNSSTAWVENRPDLGRGSKIEIELTGRPDVALICVVNGYAESWDLYKRNSRVRELKVTTDAGVQTALLTDGASSEQPAIYQEVNLATGATSTVKFEIRSAYAAQRDEVAVQSYADTALSEIEIWTER
jgi:hypothetical protein